MIYDFLRKVQGAHDKALQEQTRLNNRQLHQAAAVFRIRAEALQDVLGWAGFDDCDIAVKRGGE